MNNKPMKIYIFLSKKKEKIQTIGHRQASLQKETKNDKRGSLQLLIYPVFRKEDNKLSKIINEKEEKDTIIYIQSPRQIST